MLNRRFVLTASAVALAGLLAAVSTQAAWTATTINRLTFSRSVALPGVVLLPGTYAFEVDALHLDPNIVRVMSADGRQLYFTGFTIPVSRPASMARNHIVSLGEAATGEPTPIRAWYPIGLSVGHEFRYR